MVDRQALYSGTEEPPAALQLDARVLADYLHGRLEGLGKEFTVSKFKGGQSNPTYKLTGRDRSFVLRRRPPGALQPSAHAIDREYRVMAAMHGIGYPVAKPHLYCTDESIIGSAFYIVDYIDGRVFWNAELPGLTPSERTAIYNDMIDQLARVHRVDLQAVGLADFGPTADYAARNLARWSKIYRSSRLIEIPEMDWLMDALRERVPKSARTSLLHGDFGLYNLIIDAREPRIRAVLDWEMSTLGDPLVDLAHHVRPWWDIPDRVGNSVTSLVGLDLQPLGIPELNAYIDRYCELAGFAELTDRAFYLSFAQFRYAAMIQGVLKRAAQGNNPNRTVLQTQARVVEIARLARATLGG